MDFITFNPKFTNLVDGDFIKNNEIYDKVCEDGSFSIEQYMSFKCENFDIVVNYEITVDGKTFYDKGDYWTPPSYDVDINSIDITIVNVFIDDYEVELNSDLKKVFENLISENL
jgi:hypothetical protein